MKLFDEIPYLENDCIILKRITENDSAALEKMCEDEEVKKYLPTFLFEYGFADKKEAIRKMYEEIYLSRESLHLGIYRKEDPERLVGISEFYHYDPNWNKVSVGIRLDRDFWGLGIAQSAIKLQMDYLLNKTDVKRITAHVISDNVNSCRVLEKLGFRMRKFRVQDDWGFDAPVFVNKYIFEKWGNISCVKIGSGEKVMVMLPGLALKSTLGAASYIESNYGSLFKEYTIYLFDDRSNIGANYTIRERAGDVAAEMKTLGIKDACVFGASMGGMVGQYLAIDHPDLVKKLFISATFSRPNPRAAEVLSSWKALAETGDYELLAQTCLFRMHSESTIEKYGDLFKNSVGEVTPDELYKFIQLIDAVFQVNTYDELEKIQCPVYVVVSQGDRVVFPEGGQEIISRLGCSYHIYGEEYGHAVYDEAPDHRNRIYIFFEE